MTEAFQRLTPFKKVPVIDDDGFILTERYMPILWLYGMQL